MRYFTALLAPTVAIAALLVPTTPAHADPSITWGAIAVGNNGRASGIATGRPTWQAAATAANANCGFTDCGYIVVWPSTMCGAAARSASGRWAGARGETLSYARQVARHNAGNGAVDGYAGCATIVR